MMQRSPFLTLLLSLVVTTAGVRSAFAAEPQPPVSYTRDIKPILSDRCYACHGPDANVRKAELRLDLREHAVEYVIEPGDAENSELYARISSSDADLRMPPADSKKKPLSEKQIELFRRWIDEGARFDKHWAYAPPRRPEVPQVVDESWPRGAIDRFILARLEAEGIEPSPEADRRTLIRRLSFDLTGLPPEPEEVAAFVADESPDAYERLVDRLLASEHYGERMALYWLDLVRYADTNGIHGDNHREHWLYRDYVIDAFNDNKPFDQFTVEQLAGDLVESPAREQRIASGYNRLNLTTREGGAQPKEYMAKYSADRVRNASTVWLGSTMGCAECHDHKFDPFTMRDFYSLAAFFADVEESPVGTQRPTKMPTAEQLAKQKELDAQIAIIQKKLDTPTPALAAAQQRWEAALREQQGLWTRLTASEAESDAGAELKTLKDGSLLASGAHPAQDVYTITLPTEQKNITALRLEVLPHDSLPSKGPGRAGNGNFVLSELELQAPDLLGDLQKVALAAPSATHEQKGLGIAKTIDGIADQANNGWAILPHAGKPATAVFPLEKPIAGGKDARLVVKLAQNHGGNHTIGRLRLSVTSAKSPVQAEQANRLPEGIAAILKLEPDQRNEKQTQQLAAHYRSTAPELADERKQLAKLQKQRERLVNSFPEVLVTTSINPRTMRVLPRGNWLDESGPVVQPAVPEFLGGLETEADRPNRLELAQWLVDPANPLVARVQVNRFWKLLFGHGLVRSMDDFGSQGQVPSHPELLDWLAVEFVESGWDVKHMMKLVAMSAAYRQSSAADEALRKGDPLNDLFARQGRFRLPAEMVRDNALAISGLLVPRIGGPSAKPYQPAGYWSHLNFPKRKYQHDKGENQYRRGLYTYWCRTFLHPSLLAFDAPSREECAVERPRSNTPLQALTLLNDPTYVEAARVFAERIMREGGEDVSARLQFAFNEALARRATGQEVQVLIDVYRKHLEQYTADPKAAAAVQSVGLSPQAKDLDPVELAAWTSIARVILNLHETITRY